jgi:hypothetical protein
VVPPPQPVTRTATITRIELPTPGACADGPAWLKLQPCELDEVVYAVGQADLGYNESLARSTAADRARRAMGVAISDAKATSVVLKGCEVPYLYQCEKVIYAMAKMPKAGTQKLPACDATQVTATLKGSETCPAWTQRLAYKEGADLVGVGMVEGSRNPSLAERTAQSRALSNAGRLLRVEMQLADAVSSAQSRGEGLAEVGREVARCGDIIFVKVTARPAN